MANLKMVSEFSDKCILAPRKSLQDEQGLMLLDRESGPAGCLFAEMQEDSQGMADGSERLIVGFTKANRGHFSGGNKKNCIIS